MPKNRLFDRRFFLKQLPAAQKVLSKKGHYTIVECLENQFVVKKRGKFIQKNYGDIVVPVEAGGSFYTGLNFMLEEKRS